MHSPHFARPGAIALAGLAAFTVAQAQVTLTDLGTTAPTTFDTGYTGPFDQRYSFDGPSDSHGQSFLPATTGFIQYLYMAYNAGGLGTFKVHVDTNYAGGGSAEIISNSNTAGTVFTINIADFIVSPATSLSGTSADVNGSPVYWMRIDLSSANIALVSGQTAGFVIAAVSEDASDSNFIFGPHYKAGGNPYVGGTTLSGTNFGGGVAGSDFGFAVSINPDTDGDGLNDVWELGFAGITGLSDLNGTLPAGSGPGAGTGDFDGDGLSDLAEFTAGTNPTLADTDGDLVSDKNEIDGKNATGTVHGFGATSPILPDSDADGIRDDYELDAKDGLGAAHAFGTTNPNNQDSDADGMNDLYEVENKLAGGLNPNLNDATGNLDGDSGNPALPGSPASFTNLDEYLGTYTGGVRTRADKLDTDDDGYNDTAEVNTGVWTSATLTGTHPVDSDSDNDGLSDGNENLDLTFPGSGILPTNSNPNITDTDADGLGDPNEINLGTNPAAADTDGDTFADRVEALNGSTPNSPSSIPGSTAVAAGSDFGGGLVWLNVGAGVTSDPSNPLLTGSGSNGLLNSNANNTGAMVRFSNPNGVAYYSVDLRYTGTLDGQGINVLSNNLQSVQTSSNIHCGVRFNPNGSIGYFNGGTFTAGAPAGTHVAGNTYTVQFVHDIPNDTYTIKVFDRSNSNAVVLQVNPAVPTRNTTPGGNLYFGAGIQEGSTNGFALRLDNLYVSAAPIAPDTAVTSNPVITSSGFVGGDFKITFSPGGSGFILTSSNNLSDPFVTEAAATYDGIDTFTVPAAALNPGRDFFRVETAP
jgi:hypothetical protein